MKKLRYHIARWLYHYTATKPCRLISRDGQPYLERYHLSSIGGWRIYLHRFVGGDGDKEVHDHPWRAALSVVLTGAYLERVATFDTPNGGLMFRRRWVRWFNWIGPRTRHQILHARVETWTLFITAPVIEGKSWGFYRCFPTGYVFRQPFDTTANVGWAKRAKTGAEAGREGFLF